MSMQIAARPAQSMSQVRSAPIMLRSLQRIEVMAAEPRVSQAQRACQARELPNCRTTLTLGDYRLPKQADMTPLRTLLLPAHQGRGPFGARAVGELSIAGVAPAVVNAVADAVGARITSLPITAEKVVAALPTAENG